MVSKSLFSLFLPNVVLIVFIFQLIKCQEDTINIESIPESKDGDRELQNELLEVFDDSKNIVHDFVADPNMKFTTLPKDIFFFDKNPSYMAATREFKNILMEMKSTRDVLKAAKNYKKITNSRLWLQGFIGALLNKFDTPAEFPALVELLPDLMLPYTAIDEALQNSQERGVPFDECTVTINGQTGEENGVENLLWYFREDLMVNSHHWYWHLVFPIDGDLHMDRQGELFYYMHQSILARYHAERLSNDLDPVQPLSIEHGQIIKEPYYSFLRDENSGNNWTSRDPNTAISDISRPQEGFDVSIAELLEFQSRLTEAADTGALITTDDMQLNIKNIEGVNHFGQTAEANAFSVNPSLYGGIGWHNSGHLLLGFITDPMHTLGLPQGVMSDTATAMRDVVFYTWHTTTNNMILRHKSTLEPYSLDEGELPLVWPGIAIANVEVHTDEKEISPPINSLYTYWNERTFDLSKGLDFIPSEAINGSVYVCVEHLTHDNFTYEITVIKNNSDEVPNATVRIFMAPRFKHDGDRYTMEEQRHLFFVLDTFRVSLTANENIIIRRSVDSSLTLPYSKSYRQLEEDVDNKDPHCGCGWPHHLLIPKGKESGMIFDLFAMATNGDEDVVDEDNATTENTCQQGYLYCSTLRGKYPDSKPMGYPFDRKVYTIEGNLVESLEDYVSNIPNMFAAQVTIFHEADRLEHIPT